MRFIVVIIVLIVYGPGIFAQAVNDECENAIELTNLYQWCSEERAFKIYNATPSLPNDHSCHPDTSKILKDIWLTFTAKDENLKMIFNTIGLKYGGEHESKLRLYTTELYSGDCQNLQLDTCIFSGPIFTGTLRVIRFNYLVPEQKYYIRIATPIDSLVFGTNLFDTIGNFQFCLDSYGIDLCDNFSINTTPDTLIDFGETVTIAAQSDTTFAAIDYTWYIGDSVICSNCPEVSVQPFRSTSYRVVASNTDDCVTSRIVKVNVRIRDIDRIIFVPNAFSPNGDGINDQITIFGSDLLQSVQQLDIYDRWGNLAFRKMNFDPNDVEQGWDGTGGDQYYDGGTFVYLTRVQFIDGSTKTFQGNFHLIR